MKIMVINGPNLRRLDLRDSSIYGELSYESLLERLHDFSVKLNCVLDIRQSDSESEIISWLHEASDEKIPLIINPAAFTHYSYAIRDALEMVKTPTIEVHLSNPAAREEFRHLSVISGVVDGSITGFGSKSYELAMIALIDLVKKQS
jgi:3-dehydroquinate dehydratase-2